MSLSTAEENYLKALFQLTLENREKETGTNKVAEYLGVSPASVNAMLKRLKSKDLVSYERYGKLQLSELGQRLALDMIRRHRLWETFLYRHLNFGWEEIHEVAEELEHIHSPKLIRELEAFMGNPRLDPHGDSIPSAEGEYEPAEKRTLSQLKEGMKCRIVAVKDGSVAFLQYVSRLGLELSSELTVIEKRDFDQSLLIRIGESKEVSVSSKFASNVYVSAID
jgi:DtxR family Mn-dependent transcriptional regulator